MKILTYPLLHKKDDFRESKLIFPLLYLMKPREPEVGSIRKLSSIYRHSDLFLQTKKILEAGNPLDM